MGEESAADRLHRAKLTANEIARLQDDGKLSPREYARWTVRLAAMFLAADAWTTALSFLNLVPRWYLRHLPEDCEADPELADRAYAVAAWLKEHASLDPEAGEPPLHMHVFPAQA